MTYDFRDRLQAIMQQRGYTTRQLELRTGISRRTFANWKDGRYPNCNILIELADELQVSADELLGLNRGEVTLKRALRDAKLSGCRTCRYGQCFNGRVTVCTRQDDGVFPREDHSCWSWRGWKDVE